MNVITIIHTAAEANALCQLFHCAKVLGQRCASAMRVSDARQRRIVVLVRWNQSQYQVTRNSSLVLLVSWYVPGTTYQVHYEYLFRKKMSLSVSEGPDT